MENQNPVLDEIRALRKAHEDFVAEWRVAREQAATLTSKLAKEREAIQQKARTQQKWIFWVFGVVLVFYFIGPTLFVMLLPK